MIARLVVGELPWHAPGCGCVVGAAWEVVGWSRSSTASSSTPVSFSDSTTTVSGTGVTSPARRVTARRVPHCPPP